MEVLKINAERDADTLTDTLNANQVLLEEVKVKDKIIKANEKIINEQRKENEEVLELGCVECEYTTSDKNLFYKHMSVHRKEKHQCKECNSNCESEEELSEHVDKEHSSFKCEVCEKIVQSQHALKQHMSSIHSRNKRTINIECTECKERFLTGHKVEEHMKTKHHSKDGFEVGRNRRECRYFRNGYCNKGDTCMFKHTIERNTQVCRNGENCYFLKINKCKFYHQKMPRKQTECRYREGCRNLSDCRFYHPIEDLRQSDKQIRECN